MNDFANINFFFLAISSQEEINTTHISMYICLYLFWKNNNYKNPFQITRLMLMQYAKVNSKATYHKCIKQLHALGYIVYEPSFHPQEGSKVSLVDLSKAKQNEQAMQ